MRLLAIHHEPQECGDPFILFVDMETGEVQQDRTVTIKGNYWDSGCEWFYTYTPTGRKETHARWQRTEPPLGEKLPMKRGKWLSTSVEKHEGNYPDSLVRYDIEYSEMIERCERRFLAPDKDEFRVSLERQGLNMKGWNAYKRHKTEYRDFIRAIMPDDVINVVFI